MLRREQRWWMLAHKWPLVQGQRCSCGVVRQREGRRKRGGAQEYTGRMDVVRIADAK